MTVVVQKGLEHLMGCGYGFDVVVYGEYHPVDSSGRKNAHG